MALPAIPLGIKLALVVSGLISGFVTERLTRPKAPRRQAEPVRLPAREEPRVQPKPVEKPKEDWRRAIDGDEAWRSTFEGKLTRHGYSGATAEFLQKGMSFVSASYEMLKLGQNGDKNITAALMQRQKEIVDSVPAGQRKLFNNIFGAECEALRKQAEQGRIQDASMLKVQDNVLNRFRDASSRGRRTQGQGR